MKQHYYITNIARNVMIILLLSGISSYVSGSDARFLGMHVPSTVVTGDSAILSCEYDKGSQSLYSVRWYKDDLEFFSLFPSDSPPLKMYKVLGVDIDMSRSNATTEHSYVYLRTIYLQSYGDYKCEVSMDAPPFETFISQKLMKVVVPPSFNPILTEEKSDYMIGDNVSVFCTSGKALSAPILKWYINDKLVYSEDSDREMFVHSDNRKSTRLALNFNLEPDIFQNGIVVLKCSATLDWIPAIYAETVREIRDPETVREISNEGSQIFDAKIWNLLWIFVTLMCLLL